jgi:outer membrane protein OmpA-like peptidoglycan-associated protein
MRLLSDNNDRIHLVRTLFSFVLLAWPVVAEAQGGPGITLDRYYIAETTEDGFAVSSPYDLGMGRFGIRIDADYANDPLVWETRVGDSDTEREAIIAHHLVGQLSIAVGLFDRLVLFAGIPASFWMDGDDPMDPAAFGADGTGIGDPWFGARLRIVGENDDAFGLAVQGTVFFPIADVAQEGQAYLGERSVSGHPELVIEARPGGVRITGNAGVRFREAAQFGTLEIDEELTYGVGVVIPLVKGRTRFDAHLEWYGSTSLEDFGGREVSPMEAIGGFKLHFENGASIGLAAGPGILRGYGTPDLRAIVSVGFTLPEDREPIVEIPPPPPDRDRDGILDAVDECPSEPEDIDQFEDENGCPDPDNDQDGVLDPVDGAPLDPEDRDDFEDTDGVPDPDNDQDGILDEPDQCKVDAEDLDGIEDEDGCPELDADGDTVRDPDDHCPLTPGVADAENPDGIGCPARAYVRVETGEIVILERVEFGTNRDRILDRSAPVLEDVLQILTTSPHVRRLRVEGHTDDRGRDASNLELSRRRAASVKRWFLQHGIDAAIIEAWGCGELIPREPNRTREGRQTNRRVEFHITDPVPTEGGRNVEGCVQADDVEPRN